MAAGRERGSASRAAPPLPHPRRHSAPPRAAPRTRAGLGRLRAHPASGPERLTAARHHPLSLSSPTLTRRPSYAPRRVPAGAAAGKEAPGFRAAGGQEPTQPPLAGWRPDRAAIAIAAPHTSARPDGSGACAPLQTRTGGSRAASERRLLPLLTSA